MNQPLISRRAAMSLDDMLKDTDGVLDVDKILDKIAPGQSGQTFRPDDDLLKFIYLFSQAREGRPFFEWLLDMTIRSPYPRISGSFEQAALDAAKHQARAGIGEVILEAIAEGKRLVDRT